MKDNIHLFFSFIFCLLFSLLALPALSQCTEKDPEMAKYLDKTKTQDAQGCSQCAMLALYFCSAKYTVTADDKRKVSAMIAACKGNIRQMGQPYCCPEYLNMEPQWGIMAGTQTNSASSAATQGTMNSRDLQFQNTIQQFDQGIQNVQAIQQVKSIEKSIYENSALNGNYKTAADLEADFNRKTANLNTSLEQLATAENRQLQVAYAGVSSQLSPEWQALGGAAVQGLSAINSAQVENEKRRAAEHLEAQRQQALRQMELEKHLARIELRKDLFAQYHEQKIPLTVDRNKNEALYYFAYGFDPQKINDASPNVLVSKVFLVRKYSDGTWPFHKNIVSELSQLGFVNPTITGGNPDMAMVEQQFRDFTRLIQITNIVLAELNYEGKNSGKNQVSGQDFWGKPVQVKEVKTTEKQAGSAPDYWGETIKKN